MFGGPRVRSAQIGSSLPLMKPIWLSSGFPSEPSPLHRGLVRETRLAPARQYHRAQPGRAEASLVQKAAVRRLLGQSERRQQLPQAARFIPAAPICVSIVSMSK